MNYPKVITLRDGKSETVLQERDFEHLVEAYMGTDALNFFRTLREEDGNEIRDLVDGNVSLQEEVDHLRSALREAGIY